MRRELNGQFSVKLPFKVNRSLIGESRTRALKSLVRMEKQLDSGTRSAYVDFMKEYENLGHMVRVPSSLPEPKEHYYIPHLAVLRPNSTTTKLRVVFNASAKSSIGISLNEALMVGPSIQPELFDTLIRFRRHRYAFCADISKMYRCIDVRAEDRDMQRILWRETPSEEVNAYQLTTLTYGTAPASYIATQCLNVLADEIEDTHPGASRVIRSDFYVDDLLTDAESLDEVTKLQAVVHSTLQRAQLPLRKYMSNSEDFLSGLESDLVEKLQPLPLGGEGKISVLGLKWDPVTDRIGLIVNARTSWECDGFLTKRLILSEISRIYDPHGLVAPVVIRAKIILQDIWREGRRWDDAVSRDLENDFRDYYKGLQDLSAFSIPRRYSVFHQVVSRQLVGFCDASTKAYCAVVYYRSLNETGEICSQIVCSKTRVAPVKALTIPRLELQAACLLSRLLHRVATELQFETKDIFAFSDSTIVLSWVNGTSENWTIYVKNRVDQIRDLGITNWCYVRTSENPADRGTRGISAAELVSSSLWSQGPRFLEDESPFILFTPQANLSELPELRKQVVSCNVVRSVKVISEIVEKLSSLSKIIKVISYVFRFGSRNRIRGKNSLVITPSERNGALRAILKVSQESSFAKELSSMKTGKVVDGAVGALSPFVDENGLMRVGGRIQNANLSYERRHPVILSAKDRVVELLVRDLHSKYFHATLLFVVGFLQSRYWIVGGLTNIIKKVINKCTVCIRYKARTCAQIMGNLPSTRITVSRPFTHVGIDFAGPFSCKCTNHRAHKFYKIYVALFVCFVTRSVHLEFVKSLSTEDFLACLSRFCARRAVPSVIHSDNATNFKGAENLLFAENSILLNAAARDNIDWRFIPPRAPHQGGIWESAVKSAKYHLARVTNGVVLNYEEYATLFTKIEGILNSRPLCYTSVPDKEKLVLTPSHFLLGSELLKPEESTESQVPDLSIPLTRRYEMIANQLQSFWSQWRLDYLNQLQKRSKWKNGVPMWL